MKATPIEAPAARRDFILSNTRLIAPPLTPEIRLMLADEAVPIWRKTEEELGAIGLPPPFWAFAWAGGQALARYALDNSGLVRGKRVLDFASGSGLVAIAAAKAGAAEVAASDIDAFAIAAIEANAALNGVCVAPRLEDLIGTDEGWRSCWPAISLMRRISRARRWIGSWRWRAEGRRCLSAILGGPTFPPAASIAWSNIRCP